VAGQAAVTSAVDVAALVEGVAAKKESAGPPPSAEDLDKEMDAYMKAK